MKNETCILYGGALSGGNGLRNKKFFFLWWLSLREEWTEKSNVFLSGGVRCENSGLKNQTCFCMVALVAGGMD